MVRRQNKKEHSHSSLTHLLSMLLFFLERAANLILCNFLKYEKDVIITYETHNNNNDMVSIYLECDNTCF